MKPHLDLTAASPDLQETLKRSFSCMKSFKKEFKKSFDSECAFTGMNKFKNNCKFRVKHLLCWHNKLFYIFAHVTTAKTRGAE